MSKENKDEKKDVLDEIIEEINALDDNLPAEGGQPAETAAAEDKLEFDYGFLDKPKKKAETPAAEPKAPAETPAADTAPPATSPEEAPAPPLRQVQAQPQQYPQQPAYYAQQPARDPSAPKKRKKKKKRRSRLPGVLILTTFIFGVSIVLSMVIIGYGRDMFGIGKSDQTHLIVIPEGATTEEISELLEDDGIIKSPKAFQLFSRLRKSDALYIPGEHFVSPNMAYETIITELTTVEEEEQGDTVEVTFPEGITILEAANILEENDVCKADDFIFYFNAGGLGFNFEKLLPTDSTLKFMRMEGYLFPDTYFFYQGMDVEQVCQKIYLNFDNKLTEERLERMEELGLSLDRLITFASIVQKEAATTDTMTMVASVFWNRLDNPDIFPLLQSDPTSNYAKDVVGKHMEVYDQTFVDSYDTYVSPDLPPGAICNPGIEAIDAVLAKAESSYFYFYANIITGQTYFADTVEEHEENIDKVDEEYAEIAAAQAAAEAAGQ